MEQQNENKQKDGEVRPFDALVSRTLAYPESWKRKNGKPIPPKPEQRKAYFNMTGGERRKYRILFLKLEVADAYSSKIDTLVSEIEQLTKANAQNYNGEYLQVTFGDKLFNTSTPSLKPSDK